MIEIYHGDGKGKTTAAIGLAVRAAGRGVPVIFVQFLKNDSSGEVGVLRSIENITVLHSDVFCGFAGRMTDKQKTEVRDGYSVLLDEIECELRKKTEIMNETIRKAADISALVVLDEIIHACNFGLADETEILALIERYVDLKVEFVLTGRHPSELLTERADYVSEIKKCKHPYDTGMLARVGIEL